MNLDESINKLSNEFNNIPFKDLTFIKDGYKVQKWLGKDKDSITICVLKSKKNIEDYHKQDYFFFNYAYKGNYKALSLKYNNLIDINEDECYFSQPDCGYAININNIDKETIIVGVLIKKEIFFKEYLSIIANDNILFNFFINPEKNNFSEEYIKIDFKNNKEIKNLLNLMIIEYVNYDNQEILKSYTLSLLLLISREYNKNNKETNIDLTDQIIQYINKNSDTITLNKIATYFGYHPNYISSLIHKKTGKKFNDIIIDSKMRKAKILIDNTSLSNEEISDILGYSDPSNFYKIFKKYYNITPRAQK